MLRVRKPFFATLFSASCAAFAGLVACTSTTSSTTVATITGVVVRAETLTRGRGCGRDPSQVLKMAAVVYGYDDTAKTLTVPVAANAYDCFTDATFVNLPISPGGNADFRIDVLLYDEASYDAHKDVVDGANAGETESATRVAASLATTNPTWTTTCHATQLDGVQVLAACDPVTSGSSADGGAGDGGATEGAAIELATGSFTTAQGEVLKCRPDAGDAGLEETGDASSDAGDASDAGKETRTFDTVRVRYRTQEVVGTTVDVTCPAPFVLTDAPLGDVVLDVGLISKGLPIGQTSCNVTAIPGATSSAVCAPFP